jgi:hypothetical protein
MVFAVEGSVVVRVWLQYVAVGVGVLIYVGCCTSSIVIEKRPNMRAPTKTCTYACKRDAKVKGTRG